MKITIVGGGNVGTQFAVHCAEKMHQVTIYSSKPELFSKNISIVDENGFIIHQADNINATNNDEIAFTDADIIFVTVPAYCMKNIANKILPYVRKGIRIGLIPGTGAGECSFKKCIDKGAIIFGLQRVPSVARLVEYGKSVCATGYRKELYLASIPSQHTKFCCKEISDIFDMICNPMPNYLNLTLTPSNPILHTTRLKTIFKEYNNGVKYLKVPLFYEEWNDETSELLLKCDDEVQLICKSLKEFDLSYVKSLKIHYESETAQQLTKKISSIQSFKGLKTPTIEIEGKYIPDLDSRYFKADFSFGLSILVQIANLVNVNVPNLKKTLQWYKKIVQEEKEFNFSDFNINNYSDFLKFYKR